MRLYNSHAFGHCITVYGQEGHRTPKSEGARKPMKIIRKKLKEKLGLSVRIICTFIACYIMALGLIANTRATRSVQKYATISAIQDQTKPIVDWIHDFSRLFSKLIS